MYIPFQVLGPPELLGGPTGSNFDSPFHVFNVRRPDGSSRLLGYNNNGDSYRILDGPSLSDLVTGWDLYGFLCSSGHNLYFVLQNTQ